MGLSAAEWSKAAAQGAELLGSEWAVVGRGRKARVYRVPVGWWAQYVGYENTSLGQFVGWGSLLIKPASTGNLVGDSGHFYESVRRATDHASFKEMTNVRDSEALATFARFVDTDKFSVDRDLLRTLEVRERKVAEWQSKGRLDEMYQSNARQLLVMLRVLCGSRSREDLISDVRWVLEDDLTRGSRMPGGPRTNWNAEFYPELLGYLESADRSGMEQLLLTTRQANLTELGVPEEYVADVVVPDPEVAW